MRALVTPALCLALAACQPTLQEAPYPGTPDQANLSPCGGELVTALIGQDIATLPANGSWGTLRVISPGMAVTEDFSETRLNVMIDAQNRITGASCG